MITEALALCIFAFFAGLLDAIAGGGGLIQVPALFVIYPSAAPSLLLGTNKLSSVAGTLVAALRYGWSVPIPWRTVLPAAAIAGFGAFVGAKTVTLLDPAVLRPVVLALLVVVGIYTTMHRGFGTKRAEAIFPVQRGVALPMFAMVMGFYDGFFGPGAGSFLLFGLVRLFGYDFLSAAAVTKVLNLATNLGALWLFAATGNVLYTVAIPMAACNLVGALFGAHLAVRKGAQLIRVVFLLVIVVLIAKVFFDLLKQF